MDTEQQLAWEKRQRPRAALAAILAALLGLGGGIYSGTVFSDVPRGSVAEALGRLAESGPVGSLPSLRIPLYEWYDEHVEQFFTAAGINAASALAIGGALTFLAYAAAARRATFPRAGLYVAIIGAVLLTVSLIMVAIGTAQIVDRVLASDRTVDAVADVRGGSLLTTGQLLEVVGRFTLGAAFIIISLNAMRAGLLTRFMGVLGIIAGALLALPVFGGPLPVVQSFWLLALGLLFAGRWPNGEPPSWRTGTEMPWPSGAEVRERRRIEAGGVPEDLSAARSSEAAGPSPATSKKKRKRR